MLTKEDHLKILEDAYELQSFRNQYSLTENSAVPLPPETLLWKSKEYLKCMLDPIYFAENYYTIVSLDKGQHIIKTYPKQAELITTMIDDDRVVVLAARQTGKCFLQSTQIKIRNKYTGEVEELTVQEFIEKLES